MLAKSLECNIYLFVKHREVRYAGNIKKVKPA